MLVTEWGCELACQCGHTLAVTFAHLSQGSFDLLCPRCFQSRVVSRLEAVYLHQTVFAVLSSKTILRRRTGGRS